MAATRLHKTLADYVAIALSPALIMALVGSLVFFLIEVLYLGHYQSRVQWVMFFFVFAAVLIARISMQNDLNGRAPLYGIALGLATAVCLTRFVEYSPGSPLAKVGWLINLVLMGVVWWCAHKLTWDCTLIDDTKDASGEGLLEAAGLKGTQDDTEPPQAAAPEDEPDEEASPARNEESDEPVTLWERYRKWQQKRRERPHTPGVWVIYFSLAALPIFGLGQMLVPASNVESRNYIFYLLCIYVGSGLGLLLTTSFLGLRRYLRQRKVQMPAAMTGVWIGAGVALIAVMLFVGAMLPRPAPGSLTSKVLDGILGSTDRHAASRHAILRDSHGKGRSNTPSRTGKDPNAQAGSGGQRDKQGNTTAPGKSGQGGSGQQANGSSGGNQGQQSGGNQGQQSGNNQGQQSSGNQGQQSGNNQGQQSGNNQGQQSGGNSQNSAGKSGNPGDRNDVNQQNNAGAKPGEQNSSNSGERNTNSKTGENRGGNDPSKQGDNGQNGGQQGDENRNSSENAGNGQEGGSGSDWSSSSDPSSLIPHMPESVGSALKWIIGIIVVLVIGYLLLRFFATFSAWARGLLLRLHGRKPEDDDSEQADGEEEPSTPRPFHEFSDPFADGSANRNSPNEVVDYSYEALESWAWEQRLGREPEETPLEFASRVGASVPKLDAHARRLADLHARSLYAAEPLNRNCLPAVQQFWQNLNNVSTPGKMETQAGSTP